MTEQQSLLIRIIGTQLFDLNNGPDKEMSQEGAEKKNRDFSGKAAILTEVNHTEEDWDALLTEAEQQAMLSIVFSFAEDKMPEGEVQNKYMKKSSLCMAASIRNLYFHSTLHQLLQENNIPYVILKGQASAMYYPKPMLRDSGDVDFLVHSKDIEIVDRLLAEKGFTKSKKADEHEFHWAYKKNKARLELHWDIPGIPQKNQDMIRRYILDIIDCRELMTTRTGAYYVPTTFHHGLVLLLHTISHISSSGVGLRHLCDWLVFENSMPEDVFLSIFKEPLHDMGIWTFAQVITRIGVLYFGCEERAWCCGADEALCAAFLEDILKGGNFGVKDVNRKSQVMLIQDKSTQKVSNGDVLMNALASINRRAIDDFPIGRKILILRPFIWSYVIVQYLVKVRQGKKRSVLKKKVLLEAVDRKSLYAKLKLYEK